ncbi:hypothetical protein [Dactylosporangium sp. NPDC005555]|uniref:hypothetical protein n=1 Tax=Dactylosporangium sp. NPDC005555 TaxID=3154889 RepID=UPI0033B04E50
MAAESPAPHDPDQPHQVEALIDELILEILDSADQGTAKTALPGGLLESVRAGMSRTEPGGSTLERLLVAETLAGVLADALAPALAEVLAPRIMKVLDNGADAQPVATRRPAKAQSSRSSHARKTEPK